MKIELIREHIIVYKRNDKDSKWRIWEGPYENKYLAESMAKTYNKRLNLDGRRVFASRTNYTFKFSFSFKGFIKKQNQNAYFQNQ